MPSRFLVLAAALCLTGSARADSSYGKTLQNLQTYQNNFFRESNRYSAAQGRLRDAAAASRPQGHAPLTATSFQPASPGHPVVAQMLGSMSEADRAAIAQLFDAFDRMPRRNNVAASAVLAVEMATYVVSGRATPGTDEQQLFATLNDRLAPAFARMSATDKQNVNDGLLLMTALMIHLEKTGQKDASVAVARKVLAMLPGS